jgi:ribosomal protein L29
VKIKEVRDHSSAQLGTELEALERRLFDLRTQSVTDKVKVSEIIKGRKDVAKIKTVLRERELATQAGGSVKA